MIGQTLIAKNVAVVINTSPHDAGSHLDVIHRRKLGHQSIDEAFDGGPLNRASVDRCPPTPMICLFEQDYPCAGTACGARRLEPRDAPDDDQHIAKRIEVFIGICVFFPRGFSQPRRMTNDRFVHMFPERAGMDEHLVIETRWQKSAEVLVDRAYIKFEAGPVVLAFGIQSVEQLGCGGPLIWLKLPGRAQVHQCIGFFGASGHDPSGPVVFKGSTDQHLVVGQQSGSECISFETAQLLAVEGKADSIGFIQQATTCGNSGAHNGKPWYLRRALMPPAGVFRQNEEEKYIIESYPDLASRGDDHAHCQ